MKKPVFQLLDTTPSVVPVPILPVHLSTKVGVFLILGLAEFQQLVPGPVNGTPLDLVVGNIVAAHFFDLFIELLVVVSVALLAPEEERVILDKHPKFPGLVSAKSDGTKSHFLRFRLQKRLRIGH